MTRRITTRMMSDKHEKHLADVLGGRVTVGSGSTFKDQMDGRNEVDDPYAFIWDGKSTLNKSISITREMWQKARFQSSGFRTALALRFYTSETLNVGEDLVVLSLDDFQEILEAARACPRT